MSSAKIGLPATQAASITLLVVTSAFSTVRLLFPFILSDRRLAWKDGWIAVAFVAYLSLAIVYIATMPVIYRIGAVADGTAQAYAGVLRDATEVLKIVFATTMLHWVVLWGVKFSMLAFYKELVARLKTYIRLWWAVTIFTAMAFCVSVLQFWFTCKDPAHMFIVGTCLTPTATHLSHVSLWMGFVFDITTDIMIMLLPFGLIRQARMPLRQKLSIGSIFCLAIVCIISSAIRVHEVGQNMRGTSAPSITWLALWSLVEASIAIIIGCGPGLYECLRKTAAKHKSTSKGSSHPSKAGKPIAVYDDGHQDLALSDYKTHKATASNLGTLGDAASSQEELTSSITLPYLR